tara:strand:+ start:23 stop:376 length:354 start_codon:yes stop_codon:yes gene_type:complete
MSLDLSLTAADLMKSLGNETYITITRKSGGVFDPVAGETTGQVLITLPAVGVVTRVDNRLVDGTRIKSTDKMVLLDNSVTPTMDDLLKFDGINNTVVQIMESNHAGITQMWKVITRG